MVVCQRVRGLRETLQRVLDAVCQDQEVWAWLEIAEVGAPGQGADRHVPFHQVRVLLEVEGN